MKYYHVWFQTKYKKYLLIDLIDPRLHELLRAIAVEKGIELLAKRFVLKIIPHNLLWGFGAITPGSAGFILSRMMARNLSSRRNEAGFPVLVDFVPYCRHAIEHLASLGPRERIGRLKIFPL